MWLKLLALFCILAAAQRSFVEPAPTDNLERSLGLLQTGGNSASFEKSPGTYQYDNPHEPASSLDEEVKELERLKPPSGGNEGLHPLNEGRNFMGQGHNFMSEGRNLVSDRQNPNNDGLNPMSEGRNLNEGRNTMTGGRNSVSESLAVMKSHAAMYSNINGRIQGKAETKQEVNKNGETFAKIRQNIEAKNRDNSPTPETNIITAVDIPGQNIHKVYHQRHPVENSENKILNVLNVLEPLHSKRNMDYSSTMDQEPLMERNSNVQASPKDIAEYVFWTGDEKSVTSAIEDYMQAGLMSREEAITLLEDIKLYLGDIQDHYEHEKLKHQIKFSRSNEIPQAGQGTFSLNNLKRSNDFDNTELNQIRQQLMKSNYNKGTSSQMINSLAQSKYPSYGSRSADNSNSMYEKFSEEDYDELIEKLKVADLQYTEYSLEDIIYQLAKVMFAQSLAHGNSEAQDALQKFTSFLENDVDQGRISRTLEKKVIDILIASLSDTLNDHPEFLGAARGDNVHPHMSLYSGAGHMEADALRARNPLSSSRFKPMYSESGNGDPDLRPSGLKSSTEIVKKTSTFLNINPARVQKVIPFSENKMYSNLNLMQENPRMSEIFEDMSERTAKMAEKSKEMSGQFVNLSRLFRKLSTKTDNDPQKTPTVFGNVAEMSRKIAELSQKYAEMSHKSKDLSEIFHETPEMLGERSQKMSSALSEMSRKIADLSEMSEDGPDKSLVIVEKRDDKITVPVKEEVEEVTGYTKSLVINILIWFLGVIAVIAMVLFCFCRR